MRPTRELGEIYERIRLVLDAVDNSDQLDNRVLLVYQKFINTGQQDNDELLDEFEVVFDLIYRSKYQLAYTALMSVFSNLVDLHMENVDHSFTYSTCIQVGNGEFIISQDIRTGNILDIKLSVTQPEEDGIQTIQVQR